MAAGSSPAGGTLSRFRRLRAAVAVRNGPQWTRTAIIVTYDENGGFWDHVPPPVTDRWRPGTRVPTLIISPFARRGYVDHTFYDTTSILAFLERRWRLEPQTDRDARANDLMNAFDFGQGSDRSPTTVVFDASGTL